MGEIVLVRHGQANSTATTEEDYDRLSDLGRQQATWLGEWMTAHDETFDHVYSGTLHRQRETAQAMGFSPDEDARLNEMDYYTLAHKLLEVKGEPLPSIDTYAKHAPKVFAAWQAGEIEGVESFGSFETRVAGIIAEASKPGARTLCVTSGGVIAMVLRQLLGLDVLRYSQIMLPIFNSSVHRLIAREGGVDLLGFNAIPHLALPERAVARTYV